MEFTIYGPGSGYFNDGSTWKEDLEELVNKFKTIDTTKYDIVEKKEAKLERLQSELKGEKDTLQVYEKMLTQYSQKISQTNEKINKLEEELKELEG